MQFANKSANDPCKVNPYHQSGNNCLRNSQCPFKDKPAEMRAVNFSSNEMISINDQYCALCRSSLVPCPKPPPPPPPPPPPWLRWAMAAGLLLLLLGSGLWWYIHNKKPVLPPPPPPCADGFVRGDTCIDGIQYQRLCDGQGGYRRGDKIGTCKNDSTTVCQAGKVVGSMCQNGSLYQKVCDGKGGFKRGELIARTSHLCGDPECQGDRMVKQRNGNYHLFKCEGGKATGYEVIRPDDPRYPK